MKPVSLFYDRKITVGKGRSLANRIDPGKQPSINTMKKEPLKITDNDSVLTDPKYTPILKKVWLWKIFTEGEIWKVGTQVLISC